MPGARERVVAVYYKSSGYTAILGITHNNIISTGILPSDILGGSQGGCLFHVTTRKAVARGHTWIKDKISCRFHTQWQLNLITTVTDLSVGIGYMLAYTKSVQLSIIY